MELLDFKDKRIEFFLHFYHIRCFFCYEEKNLTFLLKLRLWSSLKSRLTLEKNPPCILRWENEIKSIKLIHINLLFLINELKPDFKFVKPYFWNIMFSDWWIRWLIDWLMINPRNLLIKCTAIFPIYSSILQLERSFTHFLKIKYPPTP